MQNKAISFIVKTTFDCNMNCSYCYEGHSLGKERISIKTLDSLIDKVGTYAMETGSLTTFVWHGGEPLLLGKEFFEHIVKRQRNLSDSFRPINLLQTNGILVDDRFIDIFVQNDFKLGVSLDGPSIIHDVQRMSRKGNPTFDLAVKAVTKIRKSGSSPGVAATFTRNTLDNLDSFYSFFDDLGCSVKLLPLLIQGNATGASAAHLQVSPKEYGDGMIHLFDKWINEPKRKFAFDPFDCILRRLVSGKRGSCRTDGNCHNYFRVLPNGDIYLCGRNDSARDVLGNINSNTIESILASPKRAQYAFDKASLIEICGKCDHYDICRGGCTSSAFPLRPNQVIARDRYCQGQSALYTHIKLFLEKSIKMQMPLESAVSLL